MRTLRNAVTGGKVHHAYLFVGSRGTGKTSMAKILAACLNCEQGPTIEPCGVCDSCVSIASATSLDVIEMDAASNNSVDDIRELRESVVYAPVSGRHKVYILDEAHMLSPQAWNAFLKTLEEPPPNTVFVLATTEAAKVLPTVVDRCHRFDFARPTVEQLASVVRRVAAIESIEIPPDAVALLARHATGSFRDALGTLEQLVTYAGPQIATEDVLAVLGVADADLLFDALDAIAAADPRAALLAAARLTQTGRDALGFVRDLEAHTRDLMIVQALGEVPAELAITPEQRRAPGRAGRDASGRAPSRGCSTCWPRRWRRRRTAPMRAPSSSWRSSRRRRRSSTPRRRRWRSASSAWRPRSRLATSRHRRPRRPRATRAQDRRAAAACRAARAAERAAAARAPSRPRAAERAGRRAPSRPRGRAIRRRAPRRPRGRAIRRARAAPHAPPSEPPASSAPPTRAAAGNGQTAVVGGGGDGGVALSLDALRAVWPAVIDAVRSENGLCAAMLASSMPSAVDGSEVTVAFPPADDADFNLRKVRDDGYRQCVVAAVRTITGAQAQIVYVLDEPAPAAGPHEAAPAPPTEDEWVQRFVAEFDAEEIHPDPDPPPTTETEPS